MIELNQDQMDQIAGGDAYTDMGYAVGSFLGKYAKYSMGATSLAMVAVVEAVSGKEL